MRLQAPSIGVTGDPTTFHLAQGAQMRVRSCTFSALMGMIALGSSATLFAQTPTLPVRPMQRMQLPTIVPAGTGSYQVTFQQSQGPVSLGNASSVTFTDPAAGTGRSGMAVSHSGSTVQVQFAPDDQRAMTQAFQICASTGCVMRRFEIQTQVQGNIMTWDLQNAVVTQIQLGSGVLATLAYQQMTVTANPVSSTSGSTTNPGQASYNLQLNKQN